MFFKRRKIASEPSLAEILTQARKNKGLDLEIIAKEIAVAKKYLLALETDDYEKLPGEAYNRIFLKKYAQFLDLESKKVLSLYDREKRTFNITKNVVPQIPQSQKTATGKKFFDFLFHPKQIKIYFIAIIIAALAAYLAWEVYNFLSPPKLTIFSPPENLQTTEDSIIIIGETQPEIKILINNQEILPQPDGSFTEKLDLQTGLNHITIIAQKKIGKETTKDLYILVTPPN